MWHDLVGALQMLAAQLVVGGLLCAAAALATGLRARSGNPSLLQRTADLARAAVSLRAAAPGALVALALSVAVEFVFWRSIRVRVEPVGYVIPGLFTALGAVATAGAFVVLHAGRLEAGGNIRQARRQVRLGGQGLFLGDTALVILIAVENRGIIAPLFLLGLSGAIGLLAGLSGKPRPSGHFAAAFHAAGLMLFAAMLS